MNAWPVDLIALGTGRWPASAQRFGLAVAPVQPGSIWVHGASLGEAGIACRLARACPPAFATADTASGIGRAGLPRPVDHPWVLAPLWAEARPRAVVFVEGSWWPALAGLARRAGVPVVAVAARPSPTSGIRGGLLGWPDHLFVHDESAAAWFRARGLDVRGVCGSLKHAAPGPAPLRWPGPRLVGVSTRPGDEVALLAARDAVAPDHAVLLAPRHLERVGEVAGLLRRPWVLRSALGDAVPAGVDVLLDTFGELGALLPGASAAVIGGTFDPSIGGHSPAEARAAGVPVVHGPHLGRNAVDFAGETPVRDRDDLARGLRRALGRPRGAPRPDGLPELAAALDDLARTPAPESSPRPWARPLIVLQRLGMAARGLRPRRRFPMPVVAVGSPSARGSGKTSTALWLADRLARRGHVVGVATRGTGRTRWSLGDSAQHGPDALWLGDEGALFALAGHRVTAHADRARAVEALTGCTVVILEDGLSCSGVHSDLRIATIDARFPRSRGMIPAGEARVDRADADVWIAHHADARFPSPAGALRAARAPGPWSEPVTGPVCAFAGIGRPADFFAGLPDLAGTRGFRDHHRYTPADLAALRAWAGGRALVTTDRDAVRLPDRTGIAWRGIQVDVPGFPMEILP